MFRSLMMISALSLLMLPSLMAQEDYSDEPGYFDFANLRMFNGVEPEVEMVLDGDLISLVLSSIAEENDKIAEQIASLKLIEVRSWPSDPDAKAQVVSELSNLGNMLQRQQWKTFVKVKKESEFVRILYKKQDKRIDGVLILSLDEQHKVTVVNVIGHLDFELMGKLSKHFKNMSNDSDDDK